jgi:hypothetical protein
LQVKIGQKYEIAPRGIFYSHLKEGPKQKINGMNFSPHCSMRVKRKIPRDVMAAIIATLYMLIYCEVIWLEYSNAALLMLLFAPFMLGWMAYRILKFGVYNGHDLGTDEFGYLDRKKKPETEEAVK